MIQKAGEKARLDVSMELIRDKRYEIRDTRWRFNFVNSLDQFIFVVLLSKDFAHGHTTSSSVRTFLIAPVNFFQDCRGRAHSSSIKLFYNFAP